MQLASSGEDEFARRPPLQAKRNVRLQLAMNAVEDLPAGHELAFPSAKRRGIGAHGDLERRLLDLDGGERLWGVRIGNRIPDTRLLDPGEGNDIAGRGLLNLQPLEPTADIDLVDPRGLRGAIPSEHRHREP